MTITLFQTFSMFSFKHHSEAKDILNYLFLPDDVKNKNQLKITKYITKLLTEFGFSLIKNNKIALKKIGHPVLKEASL